MVAQGHGFRPSRYAGWQALFARATPVAQAACLAVGLVLVDALGPEGVVSFFYFRF